MKIRILGSGTSYGVPVIGCSCRVCRSSDPRDSRTRASALIFEGEKVFLIDSGPEFRLQALSARLTKLSCLLLTHPHADHIHGLDDVRPLNRGSALPVYGNRPTIEELMERFAYVFRPTQKGGGKPSLDPRTVEEGRPFDFEGVRLIPLPIKHGELDILGWRIGPFSYITDASFIPKETWPLLEGTEFLVINGLRRKPHSTHFSIDEASEAVARIGPRKAWITHINHEQSHEELLEYFSGKGIEPAFDGMEILIQAEGNP